MKHGKVRLCYISIRTPGAVRPLVQTGHFASQKGAIREAWVAAVRLREDDRLVRRAASIAIVDAGEARCCGFARDGIEVFAVPMASRRVLEAIFKERVARRAADFDGVERWVVCQVQELDIENAVGDGGQS